nr:hypothetical protein [uncultured Roseibium sp.]
MDTKHSIEQAIQIQERFQHDVTENVQGIVGVGISLNEKQDDLALNVQVKEQSVATGLPRSFNGLDVVVDVVGTVKAF